MSEHSFLQISAPGIDRDVLLRELGLHEMVAATVERDDIGHQDAGGVCVAQVGEWVVAADPLWFMHAPGETGIGGLLERLTAQGGSASTCMCVESGDCYALDCYRDGQLLRHLMVVGGEIHREEGAELPAEQAARAAGEDPLEDGEAFVTAVFDELGPGWSAILDATFSSWA